MIKRFALLLLLIANALPAHAAEGETLRFGVSWQDYTSPEAGVNLRGELILPKPALFTTHMPDALAPALFAGLSAHVGHGTSFLYAGALWTVPLTDRLFVEASLAVAANNGRSEPRQGSAAIGCQDLTRTPPTCYCTWGTTVSVPWLMAVTMPRRQPPPHPFMTPSP